MIGRLHLLAVVIVVVTGTVAGTAYTQIGNTHSIANGNFHTVIVNTTFPIPAGTSYAFNESYWPVPVFNVANYENVTISWTSSQNVIPIIIEVNDAWNPANSSTVLTFVPSAHSGMYLPPSMMKLPDPSTQGNYTYSFVPGKYMILLSVGNPFPKDGLVISFPDGIDM